MSLSKTSQAYTMVRDAVKELTEGVVLAVDPSIGSDSSMPGWAVYRTAELVDSGTMIIDPGASTPSRLQALALQMRQLIKRYAPDVLVYEAITDVPFKGYAARGHAPLQKALGAILSVAGPDKYVGIFPASWKKMVRETYVKGDEEDAIELGYVAISEAKRISETDPKKRKKKLAK